MHLTVSHVSVPSGSLLLLLLVHSHLASSLAVPPPAGMIVSSFFALKLVGVGKCLQFSLIGFWWRFQKFVRYESFKVTYTHGKLQCRKETTRLLRCLMCVMCSAGMFTVLKNLSSLTTMGGDYLFFGKRYGPGIWACILLMILSACAGGMTDANFSWSGYSWQIVNCFFTSG